MGRKGPSMLFSVVSEEKRCSLLPETRTGRAYWRSAVSCLDHAGKFRALRWSKLTVNCRRGSVNILRAVDNIAVRDA